MKTFSEKLTTFIMSQGMTKKEFGEHIKSDRQAVLNYTNGRTPSIKFIYQILDKYPDFDLNYYLKDWIDSPQKLVKVDNFNSIHESSSNYDGNKEDILKEIKALNEKVLLLLEK